METILKAGKYWIGDPCYVTGDWDSVCEQLSALNWKNTSGVWVNADDKQIIIVGTLYGDGCYDLLENGIRVADLGVVSGCLSIIPLSNDAKTGRDTSGYIVELKEDTHFEAADGSFAFGVYYLNTDFEDEEDDDYWENQEWNY